MPRVERVREFLRSPARQDYFSQKEGAGWHLVAVEWEREVEGEPLRGGKLEEEIPYGLRVASDCRRLEEEPTEREILLLMMESIIQELSLPQVAAELNRRGFRTRKGHNWGAVAVFHLLPRLIEVGPRIFTSDKWIERRRHLFRLVSGPGEVARV
jgi:hypothetical protein